MVTTFRPGFFEIFPAFCFDKLLQLLTRARPHLAEQSQFAAEIVETLTQKRRAFRFRLLGKRESKIDRTRAAQLAGDQIPEFSHRSANRVCHARGHVAERGEDELSRGVFYVSSELSVFSHQLDRITRFT